MLLSKFAVRRKIAHSSLAWNGLSWGKIAGRFFVFLTIWIFAGFTAAANHYTPKQIEAFTARVGKIFWIKAADGKLPSFRTAPAAGATTLRAVDEQSFEIVEVARGANKDPYFKVRFASGKVGYLSPEAFHEELNLTILTADPYAEEKRKAEEVAKEERGRIEWIQSQPWSPVVKQAAIKRQPVPGLTTEEIKKVLGAPLRIDKIRGSSRVAEERWHYADGRVLTFHNALLSSVDYQERK